MEVETPILSPSVGGANATPFVTHAQSIGENLYLRIAPELYLKVDDHNFNLHLFQLEISRLGLNSNSNWLLEDLKGFLKWESSFETKVLVST